jgi:hypothetical protein
MRMKVSFCVLITQPAVGAGSFAAWIKKFCMIKFFDLKMAKKVA